jgi:hypothetical protein
MTEAEEVLQWLRELTVEAQQSVNFFESFRIKHATLLSEVEHVRELVSRALEWRVAGLLMAKNLHGPDEAAARAGLAAAEARLRSAIDTLLEETLHPSKPIGKE